MEFLALSADGSRVAVAETGNPTHAIQILDLTGGKELVVIEEHSGVIHGLAFLADNRTLISAGEDKAVRISDLGIQDLWEAHPGGVAAVVFHSNGNQILSGGADKTVKLWQLTPGKPATALRTFGPFSDPIRAVALSRNSALAGAAVGKTVKLWNVADGKEVATLPHATTVTSLAFNADQTRLLSGAVGGLARVCDLTTGKVLQAFRHTGPVQRVGFSSNNAVVSAGSDKVVVLNGLAAIRVIPAAAGPVRALTLTPSGSHALTSDGKEVQLWNASSGAKEARSFAADGPVTAVGVSKNGQLVAVAGGGIVRLYEFADGKQVGQLKAASAIRSLSFSPTNQVLAAACEDKTLRTWNIAYTPGQALPVEFGKPLQSYEQPAAPTDVAFTADGTRLYSGSMDGKVRQWKVATDGPIKSLAHPNLVDAVAFNPLGTQLATGCHDGTVRIWDVAKGQQIRQINAHTTPAAAPVYCVAWTPDGKRIASGSYDHSMKLWDATAGTLVREFKAFKEKDFEKGHRDGVFCIGFSPDGKLLVSGSSDHSIKIWNVADGTVLGEFTNPHLKAAAGAAASLGAHPGWVYSLRFTPDGKKLVSAGNAPRNQGYLAVWSVADRKLVVGEELATGPIYSLAISPDGNLVALGCGPRGRQLQDGNAYILKVAAMTK